MRGACLAPALLVAFQLLAAVETTTARPLIGGGGGGIGPSWTRGEIEPPQGTKDMGTWEAAVYTLEQQARLGVNEMGETLTIPKPQPDPTMVGATPTNGTVYIIRHGEKLSPSGCLNQRGQERAQNLAHVFDGKASPLHPTYGTPRAIFANRYDDGFDCERCIETVAPIAKALSLPLNTSCGFPLKLGGNVGAAAAIKQHLKTTGGPVLVAWEHWNIQFLTADFGVNKSKVPQWPSQDFDTVYALTFSQDGAQPLLSFTVSKQGFTAPSQPSDSDHGKEAPEGLKDMGTWQSAVYTPEQQARLGVNEMGEHIESLALGNDLGASADVAGVRDSVQNDFEDKPAPAIESAGYYSAMRTLAG